MTVFLLLVIAVLACVEGTQVPAKDVDYASGFVRDLIKNEMDKALKSAKNSDNMVKNTERSLSTTERKKSESHSAVEFRRNNVERLNGALRNLEIEKNQAAFAKDEAFHVAQEAAQFEKVMAVQLADAKKKAGDMMRIAREMSEEATRARAVATAAAQEGESTDFIPADFEQTRVTLFETAERLEQAAAKAMREANKQHDTMLEMEQKSTSAWLAASKANEILAIKETVHKAKSEAYANTQAAYNKAQTEYQASHSKYNSESKAVVTMKRDLERMKNRAKNFHDVNKAFGRVYKCAEHKRSSEKSSGSGSPPGNHGSPGKGNSRPAGSFQERGTGKRNKPQRKAIRTNGRSSSKSSPKGQVRPIYRTKPAAKIIRLLPRQLYSGRSTNRPKQTNRFQQPKSYNPKQTYPKY